MNEEKIYQIPMRDIRVSDSNVRQSDKDKDIDELAASIKKHGLLQPVVLKGEYGEDPYELIVGQRRFLAHKKLGEKYIRAVFAGRLDKVQATIRSLAENMHRVELNHADAAEAITELYKQFGKDERKVHNETGMSLKRIRQYIYIEERASNETKKKLRSGKVKPIDVQRALRASGGNKEKADRLIDKMEEFKLTTYERTRLVEYGEAHPNASDDEIIKKAQKPKIERTVIVTLSETLDKGLELASKNLSMGREEVAARALDDWLSAKGFIRG